MLPPLLLLLADFLSKRIRVCWVKLFVCPHDRHEVFGIGQIDDVMRVSGKHMDCLDVVARDLEFDYFVRTDLAFLDQSVTGNDDEKFPFAVMPMLAFGDTRLGDVDAELSAVRGFEQFRERAARIAIHLQREDGFFFRQIRKIGRIELLGETIIRDLWHHKRLWLRLEGFKQFDNLTERDMMRRRNGAVSSL